MLDFEVELSKSLYPSGQDFFRRFESPQPFQTVVICLKYDFCAKKIVTEVLDCTDNRKEFSLSRTLLFLWFTHHAREESDWMLNTFKFLTKDGSNSDLRSVCV